MIIHRARPVLAAASFLVLLLAPASGAESAHMPGFAEVVRKVLPAVVDVAVVRPAPLVQDQDQDDDDDDDGAPPEGDLVQAPYAAPNEDGADALGAQGSGFIVDPAGYVVTSAHVIADARVITVTLRDGSRYPARIIGSDAPSDLALLKIDAGRPVPFVAWGDSEAASVGDWVLAAGNPFGLGGSVSAGILSARGRDIEPGADEDFLQIDAPLNRGNSGGPTFNDEGEVIGVNTAIYTPSGGSVGIGFAVPSNLARPVIGQLRARGRVVRGWLGVSAQDVTPDLARAFALPNEAGALISDVTPGGPADGAGLRHGDIVLSVNGGAVESARDFSRDVAAAPPGRRAALTVWRGAREIALSPLLAERPAAGQAEDAALPPQPEASTVMGLTLALLSDELKGELDIPASLAGVLVVDVAADSPFAGSGLERGDVIEELDHRTVTSLPLAAARLKEAAGEPGPRPTLALIDRGGEKRYVALALDPPAR